MGAFPKKRSVNKYRVVHDLSWPPSGSVNSGITDDYSVQYISIDTIASIIKDMGVIGVQMSKIDLQDAFKYIFVNPDDWELLGSTLNVRLSDGTIQKQYFIDCFLPFGLRTSPRIFCTYAEALRYIMLQNGVSIVANYIDDFFTCEYPDTIECSANL